MSDDNFVVTRFDYLSGQAEEVGLALTPANGGFSLASGTYTVGWVRNLTEAALFIRGYTMATKVLRGDDGQS